MGSFNETCALSNLHITYGVPVKVLFLTQNPYVVSDQHEAQRGVYHYDNWFCRTPPFNGKYDDYGNAKFKESPITKLIADVFDTDVVERPFGHNRYHAPPVIKGKGINHYLAAAWEGRLLVQDEYHRPKGDVPENVPTWERVHALLKQAKMPLQIESKSGENCYNAQPITHGVVCVHYEAYSGAKKKLQKAEAVLKEHYDCKIINKFADRDDYEPAMIVAPKGSFENPALAANLDLLKTMFSEHPEIHRHRPDSATCGRQLPVLSVMVREDVWDEYCSVKYKSWRKDAPNTVEDFRERIQKIYDNQRKRASLEAKGDFSEISKLMAEDRDFISVMAYKEIFFDLPFATMCTSHLSAAAADPDFNGHEELIQSAAELARVEMVMSALHKPWYIPPLNGQDRNWELHGRILAATQRIVKKELKMEKDQDTSRYE